MVGAVQAAASTGADGRLHYRPHLDGLRAVAVYLVVVFHAGAARAEGGFIGVDVFFVLSGYLVTQLLVRDIESHGRVRFGRFYARRFRRLLPASFVALVITAIAYSAVAAPSQTSEALDGFRAAFLYVANWHFIDQSADYFAADVDTNPVVHFWSLAVEEQFYLLAPLVLGGLFAAARRFARSRRVVRIALAVGALASLAGALSLRGTNLNRAYYGTDTRAYQLLAGALLALTPGLVARAARMRGLRLATPALLLALAGLATWWIDLDPVQRGVAATSVTVLLLIALEAADGGVVKRVLGSAPLVHLGRVSYGTYLWHWPVIVIAGELRTTSPLSLAALAGLIATGLASLSLPLLERPIRESPWLDRLGPAVIGTGLTASLLGGLVIIPAVLDEPRSGATVARGTTTTGFTPMPELALADARRDLGDLRGVAFVENCADGPSSDCTIVDGDAPHILVIGDSHAQALFPAFAALAQAQGYRLSTAASGGCPWQRHLTLADDAPGSQVRIRDCLRVSRDLYERVIPELRPDVIVGVSRDYLTGRPGTVWDDQDRPVATSGPDDLARLLRETTARSLELLGEVADRVVIVEPLPVGGGFDPFQCLSESDVLEACRFVANIDPLPIERIFRELADGERVWSADLDQLACPFLPICDPVIDGRIVRFDSQHLAPAFAVDIADEIGAYLVDAGIVGDGPSAATDAPSAEANG